MYFGISSLIDIILLRVGWINWWNQLLVGGLDDGRVEHLWLFYRCSEVISVVLHLQLSVVIGNFALTFLVSAETMHECIPPHCLLRVDICWFETRCVITIVRKRCKFFLTLWLQVSEQVAKVIFLLVIHFFLPLLFHVFFLLLVSHNFYLKSLTHRCHSRLVIVIFIRVKRPVLLSNDRMLVDLLNFIRRALFFLFFAIFIVFSRIDQSVLLPFLQLLLQLHLSDGLVPLIWIHLLDLE